MRFANTATSLTGLAALPSLVRGFNVVNGPRTRASTSLAARGSMYPILRRGGLFSPDIDLMFQEMDRMMESSFSIGFLRPSFPLSRRELGGEPSSMSLGFDVTDDENGFKADIRVPNAEAKDIDLQLDRDGRVLRLRGSKSFEDGGMKVQSRFEKAILLSPDVDAAKLTASMSGDTLTVAAPRIERKAILDTSKGRKIDIEVGDTKVKEGETRVEEARGGSEPAADDTQNAPTRLAVEDLKNEKADQTQNAEGEKKWPARDFPY